MQLGSYVLYILFLNPYDEIEAIKMPAENTRLDQAFFQLPILLE